MDFLIYSFMGTPVWMWLSFLGIVGALLAADLGLFHTTAKEIEVGESLRLSAIYIALGLGFAGFVGWQMGGVAASSYLTAFVVAQYHWVPAVFAITSDPLLVYTSNIFAISGLRALYFALAAILHRFAYLKYALSVLLILIGSKLFIADWLDWGKFPASLSLGVTAAILTTGVAVSLWKTHKL